MSGLASGSRTRSEIIARLTPGSASFWNQGSPPSHAFCVGPDDLASVSPIMRPVSRSVRRSLPPVSANVRRKQPLIVRRPHFDCAPLYLRPRLPLRGPAGFDGSERFGFCPLDGGRLELSGVFGGSSRCSRAVSRAVNDTTCSHSATIKASFCEWLSVERSGSGGTTMRGLNPASPDPSTPRSPCHRAIDHRAASRAG